MKLIQLLELCSKWIWAEGLTVGIESGEFPKHERVGYCARSVTAG